MKSKNWNIFEKYPTQKLLWLGILGSIVGSLLAFLFNGRFDGVLDLHFVDAILWFEPFIDNLIDILILSLFLFGLGRILNKTTRFIDMLIAVMIGRFALYLLLFTNINNYISGITDAMLDEFPNVNLSPELIILSLFGLLSLLLILVFMFLIFLGFRVAVNSKKPIHILYFLLTVFLAEIVSKLIFIFLI